MHFRRFVIRPNAEHPKWPQELDAALLANTPRKPGESRQAHADRVMRMQEQTVIKRERKSPCGSDNLDWLAMVHDLRNIGWCVPGYRLSIWVDGLMMDSSVKEMFGLTVTFTCQISEQDRYARLICNIKRD